MRVRVRGCVRACVRVCPQLPPVHSPADEAGGDGGPRDAAGTLLLGVAGVLVLPAGAAQAAQVDGQEEQVEAQAGRRHAAQEDQRLWGRGGRGVKGKELDIVAGTRCKGLGFSH